jgi:hypothetical protein
VPFIRRSRPQDAEVRRGDERRLGGKRLAFANPTEQLAELLLQ